MLKEHSFDPDTGVIDYIRAQLSLGKTLSTYLLRLPLERGRVTAYLPTDIKPEAVTRFSVGIMEDRGQREKAAILIQTYLKVSTDRYLIIEETSAQTNDPGVSSWKEEFFIHNSDIYYFLSQKQGIGPEEIVSVLSTSFPYPFVGVLSSLSDGIATQIRDRRVVSRSVLRSIADGTDHILIGAYDGTGYFLLWHR